MPSLLPVSVLVAALVAGLCAGCNSGDLLSTRLDGADAVSSVRTVNVIRLKQVDNVYETSVFYGKLQATRQSRLGFARGGRVKNVLVEIGDRVADGERLAELDQEQIENQQDTVNKELDTARQNLQIAGFQDAPGLERQIEQLEGQLKEIELELENGFVTAPFDCVVSVRHVDSGSLIAQGQPAFEVVEDGTPQVEANLPNIVASRLQVGQVVWVLMDGQAVEARLHALSPVTDGSGSRLVLLQLTGDLQNVNWSVGQTVEIRFRIATDQSGYWIPFSALQREANGLWSVYAVEAPPEPVVRRIILELLQLEDDKALVRGMLNDGMLVIADGTHRVVPGQRVEPVDVTGQLE